jgi:hypothetical protein
LSWYRDAADWQAKVIAEYVESDGQADIFSPPGGSPDGAQGFGNYEDYDRTAVSGSYDRDLNPNLAVGATVLYEDYSIDSFIRQDLANYLPGALLLVADDGGYTAWSGALRLTVRF